jgi:hypothetical protein
MDITFKEGAQQCAPTLLKPWKRVQPPNGVKADDTCVVLTKTFDLECNCSTEQALNPFPFTERDLNRKRWQKVVHRYDGKDYEAAAVRRWRTAGTTSWAKISVWWATSPLPQKMKVSWR